VRHGVGSLWLLVVLTLTVSACTGAPERREDPSGVAVGSDVVFTGDFETGDFSQWTQCQNRKFSDPCADYSGNFYGARVVDEGARQGRYAARFEVRNGDDPSWGGGERSEVAAYDAGEVREGDERWYQFSLKFADDFPDVTGNFFIVMQWHSGHGQPPMALEVDHDGRLLLKNNHTDNETRVIGTIERGKWVDYVLHVKFSREKRHGWAEVYQDGELVVPRHARSSMSSDHNYLKMGIYRAKSERSDAVLWVDAVRITAP
jgi:hypothetical protein